MSARDLFMDGGLLVSAVLFIYGLKRQSHVRTARSGNAYASLAMLVAIVAVLVGSTNLSWGWIIGGLVVGSAIGVWAAKTVPMTGMPEMVALFNGSGGVASALVALAAVSVKGLETSTLPTDTSVTLLLSVLIGGLTLTGSIVAYLKLAGKISGQPILLPSRHLANGGVALASILLVVLGAADVIAPATAAWFLIGVACVLGVLLVIPIGGADMPVVISLLNSYSGLAAAMTGFALKNPLLIIAGSLVGAAGLILTKIMCKAMNRSLANVLFGGFGAEPSGGGGGGGKEGYTSVKSCGGEEAAMILETAQSVIVVPGYGLAVAQAQHAVRELATEIERLGGQVRYAIHPVAGRMPGHMNVLLAEADIPYEQLVEMEEINSEFRNTDVALVVGANDVVNPAALDDKESPIYGMPILHVHEAGTVMMIKRSLSPGFAGIMNPLFEANNTMMLFGDAKKMLVEMIEALKEAR